MSPHMQWGLALDPPQSLDVPAGGQLVLKSQTESKLVWESQSIVLILRHRKFSFTDELIKLARFHLRFKSGCFFKQIWDKDFNWHSKRSIYALIIFSINEKKTFKWIWNFKRRWHVSESHSISKVELTNELMNACLEDPSTPEQYHQPDAVADTGNNRFTSIVAKSPSCPANWKAMGPSLHTITQNLFWQL